MGRRTPTPALLARRGGIDSSAVLLAKVILWALPAVFLAPPVLDMLLSVIHGLRLGEDPGGDPEAGTVLFIEPVRAFGVRWGARSVAAGLRRAGFAGEFRYWSWQQPWRAWLIVPVVRGRGVLRREAERLAAFIEAHRREHPGRAIHVVGYSAGGFVAAEALRRLGGGVTVDSAVLLAPAVSPGFDLAAPAGHVRRALVVTASPLDWAIVGAGTLVLGTCDGRHTPSAGMVGLRGRQAGRVVQVRWRPSMLKLGHWGGHFGVSAPAFVAERLAGHMGIGRAGA